MFLKKINLIKLFFFFILLQSCQKNKKNDAVQSLADEQIPVRIAAVNKVTATEAVNASGLIVSDKEARMSFKTGGVIEKIYPQEGDYVKKGQVLARLNMTEINAQVTQAHEGLAKLERDVKRVQNLYKDSVATLEQLQNVSTAYNMAKQNVEIADFNKNYSEIRAAQSGRIVKKIMNEGELVGPGMPVLYMTADGTADWVVRVGVSDKDWARLKVGDAANITVDAYKGEIFPARITKKAISIDPSSGLYQMELKFYRTPTQIAYGLFATAKMQPAAARSYLAVSIDAIIEGNGNQATVFIHQNGKASKRAVQTASILNGNLLIASGLTEGEEIIVSGSAYLTDGVAIKIVQ